MDAHLAQLVRMGKISRSLAEQRATVPEELKRLLGDGGNGYAQPQQQQHRAPGRQPGDRARRDRWAPSPSGQSTSPASPRAGELEASSKAQVTEQLRQRGLIVLDISESREAFKLESIFQRFKSVNMRNLSVFSRQFATLIASGMPMLRSLYTLEEQTEDEMLKPAIASLRHDVESGSSLHAAMERQPGVFDPLYRSMVRAGEGAGRLESALDRVAAQLEKLDALRRQVRSAMMYPAVVFAIALDRDDRDRELRRAGLRRHLRGDRRRVDRERRAAADDPDHRRRSRTSSPASGTSSIPMHRCPRPTSSSAGRRPTRGASSGTASR